MTTLWSRFSPSTFVWVLGIEIMSPGLSYLLISTYAWWHSSTQTYTHTHTHTHPKANKCNIFLINSKYIRELNTIYKARTLLENDSSILMVNSVLDILGTDQLWWCTPLIPVLERQKQVTLCESEDSLIYIESPSQQGVHNETLSQHQQRKPNHLGSRDK